MSRSHFATTLIPRSFFPLEIGGAIVCKDGTKLEVGSDQKNIEQSFYLSDGKAQVWLYFDDAGFLSLYDIPYSFAWDGSGEPLLRKIRGLTRGKFPSRRKVQP